MESNKEKIPCTVGILTHNSGATLPRALKSLDGFGEIIIADGRSTDNTLAIAREYGCKIILQSNPGHPITDFSLERNRTLDAATHDWFFYLDSDEVVSPDLHEEIRRITNDPIPKHLVYSVKYEKTSPDLSVHYKTAKSYYQNRFFNKKSGARFKRRMHERIVFPENISVGVIEAPWYVPLDTQLDFAVYREKIEYRIGIMAANTEFRGFFHFIHRAILDTLNGAFKSCIKMLYLALRNDLRAIPPRYELYRIYSQWVTMEKLFRRYFEQKRKKMNFSKKVVRAANFFAKILQGKNPLIVRQEKSKWDTQFKAGKWDFMLEAQPNREVIASLCAKYSKNTSLEILDVGCGNGGLVAALETQNGSFVYTGIDFSAEALQKARSNFPTKNFIHVDIEHPPTFPQKFDIIVFSEILYYVNAKATATTYAKLLKKDGILVISMYRSWRTRLVWFLLGKALHEKEHHTSSSKKNSREVHWDIKIMKPRK